MTARRNINPWTRYAVADTRAAAVKIRATIAAGYATKIEQQGTRWAVYFRDRK